MNLIGLGYSELLLLTVLSKEIRMQELQLVHEKHLILA